MNFIWYTRGRNWGLRFVSSGGVQDPFPVYSEAFRGKEDEHEVFQRHGDHLALRFADPNGREDSSGRRILHDFVILGENEQNVVDFVAARDYVWPQVASLFEQCWLADEGPA